MLKMKKRQSEGPRSQYNKIEERKKMEEKEDERKAQKTKEDYRQKQKHKHSAMKKMWEANMMKKVVKSACMEEIGKTFEAQAVTQEQAKIL